MSGCAAWTHHTSCSYTCLVTTFTTLGAMAAPRRAKRVEGEARDALLAAAERLLAERPLDELTVADILREAGVSRASFYFYFASKHDVVVALAERVIDEVRLAALPWLERSELAPEDALRAAMRGAL